MKKRVLSLLLSMAMLLTIFSGLGITASAAGDYVKITSLSVGDRVVLVCESVSNELGGISTTSTKYGLGAEYSGEPKGVMVLEVCEGATSGTYAFKNYDDKYLYWGSSNTLNANATLNEKTSWYVTFDRSGNATILNSSNTERQIWWNTGSPRFACYTGKTLTTSGYAPVQLYKATASACDHSDMRDEVKVAPTCTEAGIMLHICNKCGLTRESSIKKTGHDFNFEADGKGSVRKICANCRETEAFTMHTLSEATCYGGSSTVYNVTGVVTYIKGRTVYIEDETQGMCVYFNKDVTDLKLGDKIFVSRKMVTYYGLPEMKVDSYIKLSSGNPIPNSTDLTIGEIVADPELKPHLGKRVTLKDVSIGLVTSKGYTPLTDREGNSIYIYNAPALNSEITSGCRVDVTGIVSFYKDDFQILVDANTALTDVKKVGEGVPLIKETVPIAFAKACTSKGTYFQIEGVVTCMQERKIFLQDETGGMVVFLASVPTEAPCAVGDKIRAFGLFANYDGVLELAYVDHTDPYCFTILSHDNPVVAQPVTIEQLLYDSAIDYELFAEKIFLDDVSILEIDESGTVTLWQDDYTIDIFEAPPLNANCVVDAVVDVTATVSGFNFSYELAIVDANAVVYGSGCLHKETVAVGDYAPGCTVSGYTGDLYCTFCGAFVSKGQTIAPAHQETELRNVVEPTCTADGYSGDLYCLLCGVFMEKGKTVPATHRVVSINDVEPTCDSEGYTGEQFCEACGTVFSQGTVLPPLGHEYTIYDLILAATCTEPGYADYQCIRCTDGYSAIVPAMGHNNFYTDLGGELHSYICFTCGESGEEGHSYEDGFCVFCGAEGFHIDEKVQIRHTLNLASDISINFVIAAGELADYDMFYLECTRDIYSGNETTGSESIILDNPVLKNGYYYFTLTGINATQMGDEVDATLYMFKGDKVYCSNEDIYSVATYAYSQLNKENDPSLEKLKALCADLLRYGKEAQIFKSYRTDALVDGDMTETHRAYLSDAEAVTFGNNNTTLNDLQNPKIKWAGKSLNLESKVSIKYVFELGTYTGKVEDLTMKVHYINYAGTVSQVTVKGAELYDPAFNRYAFSFDGLLAAELRTVVDVAIYQGNTQLSQTLRYSPDTYGNNRTGQLLVLCKALFAYADTAKVFFGG